MCGISGIINFNGMGIEGELIKSFGASLAHRGPDDSGEYIYTSQRLSLALIHRRLKIIDLSERAHQPISNEDGSIQLIFNGEIYNYIELMQQLVSLGHRFKSRSDSEVIVHAYEEWGADCLEKFVGMFAFALWDSSSEVLFCARDRIGIKPFYYFYETGKSFIFASELKAFFNIGISWKVNLNALYSFLRIGYCLENQTWIKDIMHLAPGSFLLLRNNELTVKSYWDACDFHVKETSESDACKKIRGLLNESSRLCLRSDVKIGAYLSGGIDSSAVVSLMCSQGAVPESVFSGVFDAGKKYDERPFMDEMISRFSLNSRRVRIGAEDFLGVMEKLSWCLDEPVVGPGAYSQYRVCELIHNDGFKVVLGGQGGDELFGGYARYLRGAPQRPLPKGARKYFDNKRFRIKSAAGRVRNFIKRSLRLEAIKVNCQLHPEILDSVDSNIIGHLDNMPVSLEGMLMWDLKHYLPALLQVEDRLGMAFSLETRFPLLDHRLVELSLSLPSYLKVNAFSLKYIFRQSIKDILPEKIYARKDKMGFPTPFNEWIREKNISSMLREEIRPFLRPYFSDLKTLSWEKSVIGLWLKLLKSKIKKP